MSFEIDQETTVHLKATVTDGAPVDILFTTQDELEKYEGENSFRYNKNLSLLDTTGGEAEATVPEDDYALILDNKGAGKSTPPSNKQDDTAEIEFTLSGRYTAGQNS